MPRPRLPRSLQGRLLLTYLLLSLLGLGGLIAWTGLRLREASFTEAQRELQLQAALIASALPEPIERSREGRRFDPRAVEALALSAARRLGGEVTVFDSGLGVLVSVGGSGRGGEGAPVAAPERLRAAVASPSDVDPRSSSWSAGGWVFALAPVRSEHGAVVGLVQVAVPAGPVAARVGGVWTVLLTAGGAVLAVTALASVLLARWLVEPIRGLTVATTAVAGGDFSQRIPPAGPEELERLARAFNQMVEQVQETLVRQQAFVSDAAHELRSPLTAIRLRIEMLQRHGTQDPDLVPRYLPALAAAVEHLQRLVEHLLALSRLDQGGPEPAGAPLDLAPFLYDLADEMGPLFQSAGLVLEVRVPDHLPSVVLGAEAAQSVVRNLLDNAIQYTPAGGHVTLTAEIGDGGVLVSVADSGQGIAPEHLPRLFDRFYRVDKARSRRQGGVGLGLSLVRAIVESHGGRVSVESAEGEGSTFTVSLPAVTTVPTSRVLSPRV